jgi:two-component system, NarL family, response regulator DesR
VITVLIVSRVRLFSESLRAVLNGAEGLHASVTAGDGKEVLLTARKTLPRIALIDIDGPGTAALGTARLLADALPAIRIVTISAHNTPGMLREALAAGAHGFASGDQPPRELAKLLRRVAGGEIVIEAVTAAAALETVDNPLSERERDVLRLAATGLSTRLIGHRLHLSAGTVRNYLSAAVRKLGCANRLQAAARSREAGWL